MSYVTKQQLIDAFGADELVRITDHAGADDIDDDVLAAAIANAERVANSYLAPRYPLPLAQGLVDGSALPYQVGNVVRYFLYGARPTEEVESRYEEAIAWLKDLAAGRASLGETDAVATPAGRMVTAAGVSGVDWDTY